MAVRGVAVLGSTGSIGRTTLEVIRAFPDRFRVVALTANRSAGALRSQVDEHRPELAALAEFDRADGSDAERRIVFGREAVLEAATHPNVDIVVNALVGAAGLEPTLAALQAGKRLALANKESLVVGGPLVIEALNRGGGELIPVDSEHSAVFQCLEGAAAGSAVRKIVLTASGGAFRDRALHELTTVSPAEALQHPTWSMGAKITVDSATLVNKALEVVEAHYLFGLPYERVDVVIHRQSIVHSLVEFCDGSVLAQLGHPTMAVPVLYALAYPERLPFHTRSLDLAEVGALTFEPVPLGRYPAFELGRQAALAGGTAPAAFNAASEEAVAAFLGERIPFTAIAGVIEEVLSGHIVEQVTQLEVVQRADGWAREAARSAVNRITN
jgi:1-deoxy-D-xylulose-5-phosphate reductoisomerase